jgi:2'-5' RNA ligase
LSPDRLDQDVEDRLALLLASMAAFDFQLTDARWFGDEVVWLAPEPDAPFRRLTALVGSEFGTAPYGGVYEDVVPHLTLADHAAGEHMRSAEAIARELLPFGSRAIEVRLLRGGPAGWAEVRRFALG